MVRLFATVGLLRVGENSEPYYIEQGEKEFAINLDELIMWSSLSFKLLDYDKLELEFNKKRLEYHDSSDSSVEDVLERLIKKGLIVDGTGHTQADALYDLLKNLRIVPVEISLQNKVSAFLKLTLINKVAFDKAKKVFDRVPLSPLEKAILDLCGPWSVAQLIYMIENQTMPEHEEEHSPNYSADMYFSPMRNEILAAISNLYVNQKVCLSKETQYMVKTY